MDPGFVTFADRQEAGLRLAQTLGRLSLPSGRPVVAGLARGGVLVAAPVSRALQGELAALAVRKIASPVDPEFALGAVAAGGSPLWNPEAVGQAPAEGSPLWHWAEAARREADRLQARYGVLEPQVLAARPVLLVDDGLATGLTALAAVRAMREGGAGWVGLAVPVASPSARDRLAQAVDRLVCLAVPPAFRAVSPYYLRFPPVDDREVEAALAEARAEASGGDGPEARGSPQK